MVLHKDPKIIPDDFLEFNDMFGDINSPGIFIADEDTKFVKKAIILDGHSTLLIYSKNAKDNSWEAYRDQAPYEYLPDDIGDGAVLIPHNFYFEFDIELSQKVISVSGNFGGANINAIVMPMKNIEPQKFIESLQQRLSSAFSTVLNPIDDTLSISEGTILKIPNNANADISFKLALLGISIDSLKVISEIVLPQDNDEVVEMIFEGTPKSAVMEELKKEEITKNRKRKSKIKKKSKSSSPVIKEKERISQSSPLPPPPRKKQPIPSTPTGAVKGIPNAPPSTSKGIPSAPPSTSKGIPSAPPSTSKGIPSAPPSTSKGIPSAPPSTSRGSPNLSPPKGILSAPLPISRKEKEVEEEEEIMDDFMMDNDRSDLRMTDVNDLLLPNEMKENLTPISYQRYTKTSWFERMIANRVYSLEVSISSKELKSKKSVTSIISGEKASEKSGSFEVKGSSDITIKPLISGCIIVPQEMNIAVDEDADAKFSVTPLVYLGKLDAKIQFSQNGKVFHNIPLEMKVINHRVSRMITYIGALSSIIPMLFAFFLGKPIGDFMNERLELFLPALANLGFYLPIIITGVLVGGSSLGYLIRKPPSKPTHTSLSFPR